MAEPAFKLTVVTPEEVFLEGSAVSVIAPGEEGYFGVLAHHAPFISTLGKGHLIVRDEAGKTSAYKLDGGFFEVNNDKVLILTDQIKASSAVVA